MSVKKRTLPVATSLWVSMITCSATAAEQAPAAEPAKPYTLTGHVDLVSAYTLRGATTTYGNSHPGLGNVASIIYSLLGLNAFRAMQALWHAVKRRLG